MNHNDKSLANIAVGLCVLVVGISNLLDPPLVRPSGRWSAIFGPLFDAFGTNGPALALVAIGVVFIVFGIILRGKK
jgi:hypothetical protein